MLRTRLSAILKSLCSRFLATHSGLGYCPSMLTPQDGLKSMSLYVPSELRVDGPFLLQGPSKTAL